MPDAQPDPTKRFFGAALTAIGGLIFALCGLCTGVFLVTGLMPHEDPSFAGIALFVGGIPTAIGFLVMRAGLRLYRGVKDGPRPPPSAPPPG
jgi:predicted benzoate:H+ symporter BenE